MEGVEPPTAWFVARYSIQLSYSRASKLLFQTSSSTEDYSGLKALTPSGPSSLRSDVPQHTSCASVEPPTAWFVARYFIQPAGAPGSYSRVSPTCCPCAKRTVAGKMAEREGFEPSVRLLVRFLSRELVSATHPPLRDNGAYTTIKFLFS